MSKETKTNKDGSLFQTTLKVSGKRFSCNCGCNVFHHPDKQDLELYECNACGHKFRGS